MSMSARDRFARIGAQLDAMEDEDIQDAARTDPGEKILRALRWSDVWLPDYLRRLEEEPRFAAEEEERAERKADLHARYRAIQGRRA